jgi:hypothetical protein
MRWPRWFWREVEWVKHAELLGLHPQEVITVYVYPGYLTVQNLTTDKPREDALRVANLLLQASQTMAANAGAVFTHQAAPDPLPAASPPVANGQPALAEVQGGA